MTVITTRLTVAPDGTISAADKLPQGEYAAVITVTEPPVLERRRVRDMLLDDRPWDNSLPLRRADMYGDDER